MQAPRAGGERPDLRELCHCAAMALAFAVMDMVFVTHRPSRFFKRSLGAATGTMPKMEASARSGVYTIRYGRYANLLETRNST